MTHLWGCKPCGVQSPLTWPDPEAQAPPECPLCGKPMPLFEACGHCEGTGWVEATQWAPPHGPPFGECGASGLGAQLPQEDAP